MKFSGSCTANLLWFERGFQIPDGGVAEVGAGLIDYFSGLKIKDAISKILERNSIASNETPVFFRLDPSIGFNYLNIFKLKDAKLDGNIIKDLVLRIHLCNDAAEMKAKVVAIIDVVFKSDLSARDTVDLEIRVIELEKELCQVVYSSLAGDKFSLGGKNYECSIYSIGSSDKDALTLIETKNTNIDISNDQIDSYRVLLLDGIYISEDDLPHDPKFIVDLFNQENVGKTNITLFDPDGEIAIGNINYEIEDSIKGNSYIIANFVKKNAEKTTTNNFLMDFLEST